MSLSQIARARPDAPAVVGAATMTFAQLDAAVGGTNAVPDAAAPLVEAWAARRDTDDRAHPLAEVLDAQFGVGPTSVLLGTEPWRPSSSGLGWAVAAQAAGAAVVVGELDAAGCLEAIARHGVTHLLVGPGGFEALLDLPDATRSGADLGSVTAVLHAATACPPEVKRRALDWLGPIVWAYHPPDTGPDLFVIDADEWLAHPGSIGRPLAGVPHVVGDDGRELPLGEVGQLCVESPGGGSAVGPGWHRLPDLGHLDGDGFAYLSDRRTDLIVTGGATVVPREVEDALTMHPAVDDVSVIGVPDPHGGETVRAVVQAAPGWTPGPELAAELLAAARRYLPEAKLPDRIDFVDQLPRMPTGKILRRVVRDHYGNA